MVGVARFELATPASRRRCSTRLSYTPNRGAAYSQLSVAAQRGKRRHSQTDFSRPPRAGLRPAIGYMICMRFSALRAAIDPFAALHPGEGLCIYRAPSSLTGPVGASPSGKASVFGTDIPRFESWRPSQSLPLPYMVGQASRLLRCGKAVTYTHSGNPGGSAIVCFPLQPGVGAHTIFGRAAIAG